ncbi:MULTISPECIES: hypothetical protein [Mesorhizobium]|nr:hypothetical protein EOD08_10505 [Mesorhizobium sp. M6A.T.Ca.TU.002.02.2.1]RUU45831.1 hypothetical protein EOC93_05885 [Mesorhizobium sp. M6A.T.Ce.TU.002.03.1.1]RWN40391.1 MAG: hypothetical protein EOR96_15665 [Mesorhizobium sp.]RWP46253.1 MAG: hypothetical protein EOR05_22885 [Mesorhizobium sp.]RWP53576.1 MAG: hypothetical protein EOR06_14860 [Mesorhizobium sp.]
MLVDGVDPASPRTSSATRPRPRLMQQGSDPWAAAGFLGMTVEMLIQTYSHHHPDFQADAAEAIVSKARSRNLPKNVVRMPGAQKANAPVTPHIPTDKPETKVNRSRRP